MTSEERHELRYQRRKDRRERKRQEYIEQFMDPNKTFGTIALIRSAEKCRKGVGWKPSVQSYHANLCLNSRRSSRKIIEGSWKTKGFHEFDIIERGKPRHIKSVAFEERCIQRSLCDNFITPILSRSLTYDNGATLPGKGTDFALDRLTKHLKDFFRKHGRDGYIWFYDFKSYFANISIRKLKEKTNRHLPECAQRRMFHYFIDAFEDEGLGLGSQVSQISAVFYANELDHMIKDQLGVKQSARYMDDGYVICHSISQIRRIIKDTRRKCRELGITMNEKKCQIVPLHKPFRFLKTRFFLTETGKVVKRINREAVTKERRKLRAFRKMAKAGIMSMTKIQNMFHSWLYSQKRGKNYRIMENMIRFYNSIFDEPYEPIKPKKLRNPKIYHDLKHIAKRLGREDAWTRQS